MEKEFKCTFCGKDKSNVILLISGIEGSICNFCVKKAYSIINTDNNTYSMKQNTINNKNNYSIIKKPRDIKNYLDQYVIGQEDAKISLSVAVYNHYKRINICDEKNDIEIDKSNILIIGPTGSGKTLLAKSISKLLNVPFTIVDATCFTESGYVGEDVESILTRLLKASDYNISNAEKGIVFIDEIDKIARKGENISITRDVSGEGVQQGLLKILEGSIVNVPPYGGRKHPEQKMISLNTKNILFIVGGSFEGLEKIIESRLYISYIGYRNFSKKKLKKKLLRHIISDDIKKYGLIPELVGRLPIITYLNDLNKDDLKKILIYPKNAILKQYKKLFFLDKILLDFDNEAIDIIIEYVLNINLGARGLRNACEIILRDFMFDIEKYTDKKISITKDIALQLLNNN